MTYTVFIRYPSTEIAIVILFQLLDLDIPTYTSIIFFSFRNMRRLFYNNAIIISVIDFIIYAFTIL